jgi:hypothetical protein
MRKPKLFLSFLLITGLFPAIPTVSFGAESASVDIAPERLVAEIAAGQQSVYQSRSTWHATMAATRECLLSLPLGKIETGPWYATAPMPADSISEQTVPGDAPGLDSTDDAGEMLLTQIPETKQGEAYRWRQPEGAVRYFYSRIRAERSGPVWVRIQSDTPMIGWINGAPFIGPGDAIPEEGMSLDLRAGANKLVLKFFSENGDGSFLFDLPASRLVMTDLFEDLLYWCWNDHPEMDWFLQDHHPYRFSSEGVITAGRHFAWFFQPERDAAHEIDMIRKALAEIGPLGSGLDAELQSLIDSATPAGSPAWLDLYARACAMRRQQRLASITALVPRFVFTKHYTLGGSHYAYTEGQSDAQNERHFIPGSALCLAVWDGQDYRQKTLIEDPGGVIRDPDVSYDGKTILFSWKKSDREDDYHLYEYDLADGEIRQLTHGLGVADYEGIYLPDGGIMFNSTRCVQIVDCWWTEVSNLYACDRDGSRIRRLTFDQVHDNYPTVTEDGRILYTRWEYNDRGQIYPQPLFQMNPDGTTQAEFYGVNSWFPTTILHARSVPGTGRVMAIATGHHSRQTGKLIMIEPAKGRQENEGVQQIAPVRATPAARIDAYGQDGDLFQYPYPLNEHEYLVTYHPVGWRWYEGEYGPRFGIYAMFEDGRRERLVMDDRMPCSQSIPVRPRTAAKIQPSRVDYAKTEGVYYVQDVYAGPGLDGVPRGIVKTLRVVALEFRAAGIGSNENGGPGGGALISTPVAIGNGAWDPKIILGDADVHADGSAYFRAPAQTPVYFQLLDEQGRMVQTMRSWSTLQPGETASCVGCHESKNEVPIAARSLTSALKEQPQALRPFYGPARGFSFAKEIQPILDRACVECHDGRPDVPYDLRRNAVVDPGAKRRWSRAYLELTHSAPDEPAASSRWRGNADHPMVNWTSAQSTPPVQPPLSVGANRSRLMELLDAGHEDVLLTTEEMHKLAAWIDLSVPFCRTDPTDPTDPTDRSAQAEGRARKKRRRPKAEQVNQRK